MKRLTTIGIAALAVMLGTTSVFAQKIGAIDTKTVLESMPEVAAANQKLQMMQKMWQDSLTIMQTSMQSKADAYKKVLDSMTPERKEQANQELIGMNDMMTKFRDAKFGQEGELAQQQQAIFKPIFDKTKDAINNIAKKNKLSIVVDKNNVLYSDGADDLTQKVIEYIKNPK